MEEYFDVFDENGKLTGEKMLRSIISIYSKRTYRSQ